MSLDEDLRKVLAVWSDSPIWLKAVIAVSHFLAFSAIASLSETIFEWRGFFADGISFYNSYVTSPISRGIEKAFATPVFVTQLNVTVFAMLWYAGVCCGTPVY